MPSSLKLIIYIGVSLILGACLMRASPSVSENKDSGNDKIVQKYIFRHVNIDEANWYFLYTETSSDGKVTYKIADNIEMIKKYKNNIMAEQPADWDSFSSRFARSMAGPGSGRGERPKNITLRRNGDVVETIGVARNLKLDLDGLAPYFSEVRFCSVYDIQEKIEPYLKLAQERLIYTEGWPNFYQERSFKVSLPWRAIETGYVDHFGEKESSNIEEVEKNDETLIKEYLDRLLTGAGFSQKITVDAMIIYPPSNDCWSNSGENSIVLPNCKKIPAQYSIRIEGESFARTAAIYQYLKKNLKIPDNLKSHATTADVVGFDSNDDSWGKAEFTKPVDDVKYSLRYYQDISKSCSES